MFQLMEEIAVENSRMEHEVVALRSGLYGAGGLGSPPPQGNGFPSPQTRQALMAETQLKGEIHDIKNVICALSHQGAQLSQAMHSLNTGLPSGEPCSNQCRYLAFSVCSRVLGADNSRIGPTWDNPKLRHLYWSLSRSSDSTGNKNDVIYDCRRTDPTVSVTVACFPPPQSRRRRRRRHRRRIHGRREPTRSVSSRPLTWRQTSTQESHVTSPATGGATSHSAAAHLSTVLRPTCATRGRH